MATDAGYIQTRISADWRRQICAEIGIHLRSVIQEEEADMPGTGYGVALLRSTNYAIRAEKLAKEKGFEVKLIPTPRHISSDCGTALRFRWEDGGRLKALLEEHGVVIQGIYRI